MMDKKELEIMKMDKVSGGDLSDFNWEQSNPADPPGDWSDPRLPLWDNEIPDELNPVIERQNQRWR